MKYTYELDNLKRFIYLKPANENDDPIIEISKEDFRAIICGFHGLKSDKIVEIGYTDQEKANLVKHNYEHEKQEILSWFDENDWKINKVFIGEWTPEDQRWLDYLEERKTKRARLDKINGEL